MIAGAWSGITSPVYPRGVTWQERPPQALYEGGPVVYVTELARAAVSGILTGHRNSSATEGVVTTSRR